MSHAPRVRTRTDVSVVASTLESFTPSPPSRRLIDIRQNSHQAVEFPDNMFFVDLCGQIVRGEVILLAGAPGSNKSTLARQLTLDLACQGIRSLMILTEESGERAERARSRWHPKCRRRRSGKLCPIFMSKPQSTMLRRFRTFLPRRFLIRTANIMASQQSCWTQYRGRACRPIILPRWQSLIQFLSLTRAAQIMTLAICHVTKKGEVAGPKALEHAVDCSVLIRKAYTRRLVSVMKNRFGAETARPMQLEIDPVTLKLRVSPHTETLTAVVARLSSRCRFDRGSRGGCASKTRRVGKSHCTWFTSQRN